MPTPEQVLEALQGPSLGRLTPFNTVAILTRIDDYWPDRPDPRAYAAEIVERLLDRHPRLHRLFFRRQFIAISD